MNSKLFPTLAVSALVMAMSATSANAKVLPRVDAAVQQFRTNVDNFFKKAANSQIKVYAVSQSKGKYATILSQKGWRFDMTHDLSKIPNTPSTIVYVNVGDTQLKWADLAKFFTSFDGVIVIDSQQTATISANESGEYVFTGAGKTLSEGYRDLLAKSTKISGDHAPVATAVIVCMRTKKLVPLSIDAGQNVNGFEVNHIEKNINLKNYVYSNTKDAVPKMTMRGAVGAEGAFQQTAEISEYVDGIRAIAHVSLNAYRQLDATGKNYTWSTDTSVLTGDSQVACSVGGKKCGIYPEDETTLVKRTTIGNRNIITSYITKHGAFVNGEGASSVPIYYPDPTGWGKKERLETDTKEVNYTLGGSFGVDFDFKEGFLQIPAVLKGSVSFSFPISKIYPSWEGWGGVTPSIYHSHTERRVLRGITFNIPRHQISRGVISGITLLDKFRHEPNSILVTNGDFNKTYLDKILTGKAYPLPNRVEGCKQYIQDEDQTDPRPSMTWNGWQPSILVTHRYNQGTESYPVNLESLTLYERLGAIPNKHIDIVAGLIWAKSTATYTKVADAECYKRNINPFRNNIKVFYPLYTNVNNDSSGAKLNKEEVVYKRGLRFTVYHSRFTAN